MHAASRDGCFIGSSAHVRRPNGAMLSAMWRRRAVQALIPVYILLIGGSAIVVAMAPILLVHKLVVQCALAAAAPATFTIAYVLVAGGLSRLSLRAMVAGRFPRDLQHPVYGPRRLYGVCWTAIYYFPLLYHAVLATPGLKRLTFRLFGYRGSLDFATYPDTWLRDLPLVTFGAGCYLSNKATISPNMCLNNGKILIAPVSIGAQSMVGHAAQIGPGATVGAYAVIGHGSLIAPNVRLGEGADVGVAAAIGVGVRIGDGAHIGHCVTVEHGSMIGSRCDVGSRAYVGQKTVIHDGVRIPPGAVIPGRLVLRTQADVDALLEIRRPTFTPRPSSATHPVLVTSMASPE